MEEYKTVLLEFLSTPLGSGDQIFDRFAALPGAVTGNGEKPLERYVYIPGTRSDRVVLVAHIDTIWDKAYGGRISGKTELRLNGSILEGANPDCGIGADDRAGCAMLWQLRECGHSILIVDGEEHGKQGAWYLRKQNRKLFRELNKHCYMIELDWKGTNGCLFNQVDNTKKFKKYIEEVLGFADSKEKGGCDLQVLCHNVCGVNIGVGYYAQHTPKEFLALPEWENTLIKLSEFLAKPQKRFRTNVLMPYLRLPKQCIHKALRIAKGIIKKGDRAI